MSDSTESSFRRSKWSPGNFITIISLTKSNLIKNKRRSFNLLLGFIIASSLLTSMFVWNESSTKLAILDAFERKDFEIVVKTKKGISESQLGILNEIENWLANRSIVENAYQVYQSPAIFGSENLNDSVNYKEGTLEQKIMLTPEETLFFLENDFLSVIKDQFIIEGAFELSTNQLIISRTYYNTLSEEFSLNLTIGSYLNFSAITAKTATFDKHLGNLSRFHFSNYQIIGIYERIPRKTLTELSYNSETLGDGIFLHHDSIDNETERQLEENDFQPKLFIRINRKYISSLDISQIEPKIEALKAQLQSSFPQTFVQLELEDIKSVLDQYSTSLTFIFFLILPLIILCAFLINFTTKMVLKDRSREIGILRARGASSFQLILSLSLEFFIIAMLGVALGLLLGIIFGAIIPATESFLIINYETFLDFLTNLSFSIPFLLFISSSFCFILVIFSSLSQINNFLTSEIADTMRQEKARFGRIKSIWKLESPLAFSIAFAFLTILFLIFIFIIFKGEFSTQYGRSSWILVMFVGTILFWTAYSRAFSRLMGAILPRITRHLKIIFGSPAIIVSKSLQRRGSQLIPLIMILVFAFSIGTFAVVNSETIRVNTNDQIDYVIGADFKIRTRSISPIFSDSLDNIDGIKKSTHVLSTFGRVGDYSITAIGINPAMFQDVAFWDKTTFQSASVTQVIHDLIFTRDLTGLPIGIIINNFLADYLEVGVGDEITLFELKGQVSTAYNFHVIALAHSFPGFGLASDFEGEHQIIGKNGGLVVLNEAFLTLLNIETSNLFFASAERNSDHKTIINKLEALNEVIYVFSPSQTDKDELGFFSIVGTAGLATIVFMLASIIAFVSLTAFLSYIIKQRQIEYAIMRSAGATQKQIILLVLEEFVGTIIFTFFAGAIIGIVFSFVYLTIGESLVSLAGILPMRLIIPIEFIIGVLSIVVITVSIGGLIPARKAGSTKVVTVLRSL